LIDTSNIVVSNVPQHLIDKVDNNNLNIARKRTRKNNKNVTINDYLIKIK